MTSVPRPVWSLLYLLDPEPESVGQAVDGRGYI